MINSREIKAGMYVDCAFINKEFSNREDLMAWREGAASLRKHAIHTFAHSYALMFVYLWLLLRRRPRDVSPRGSRPPCASDSTTCPFLAFTLRSRSAHSQSLTNNLPTLLLTCGLAGGSQMTLKWPSFVVVETTLVAPPWATSGFYISE